jgi:hypothetical protein
MQMEAPDQSIVIVPPGQEMTQQQVMPDMDNPPQPNAPEAPRQPQQDPPNN